MFQRRSNGRFSNRVQASRGPSPPDKVPRLDAFLDGTLSMDGTEQTLMEYTKIARIMGYLDLWNMEAGDVVVIRQYMRIKPEIPYRKYADQPYSGVQDPPVIYLKPKESDYGNKITVEQVVGVLKSFDYNFIREK